MILKQKEMLNRLDRSVNQIIYSKQNFPHPQPLKNKKTNKTMKLK